jgi:hypothetical protein
VFLKKLIDFFDQNRLQLFELERLLFDQMRLSDRDALLIKPFGTFRPGSELQGWEVRMRTLLAAVVLLVLVGVIGAASARTDGGVPKLDVAQSCREAQAIGGDDKNLAYKGCMQDEKDALDQLAQKWSHFKAEDRRNCIEQGASPMPSYVEILTCLEMFDGASTFNRPAPAALPAPVAPPNATAPAATDGAKF